MSEINIIGFLTMIRRIKKEARNIQEVLFSSNLSYEEIVNIITEGPGEYDFLEIKLNPHKNYVAILRLDQASLLLLSESIETDGIDEGNTTTDTNVREIFIQNLEKVFNPLCLGLDKKTTLMETKFLFTGDNSKEGVCLVSVW